MKRTHRTAILALSCLTAGMLCAQAQDWPQWRGANRDGKASGFKAPATWPKELNQKWKVAVGLGDATPALAGDKLYVFARQETEEISRCLEAASGKEVWQEKYEASFASGPDREHAGPRSCPVVANGKVVTLGVNGTLSCLDAARGKKVWRKDDIKGFPRFHAAMSPIIVDGLCIAQLGKESEGMIVAFDLNSGAEKWKWTEEGPGYASPVLLMAGGTKLIVTETAKSVVALNVADGKVLWQTAFAPQGMSYNAATPILDGQTVIYSGQGRGTKAVKLEKEGDAYAAKELWNNTEVGVQFNTPVLKNGHLYGVTGRDQLFCLSMADGKTTWTAPSGGRRGFGSVVDAGPVLLELTPSAQLLVIEPNEKEFKQVASYKVAEGEVYAHPIASSNRVYIKDRDSVILWTLD